MFLFLHLHLSIKYALHFSSNTFLCLFKKSKSSLTIVIAHSIAKQKMIQLHERLKFSSKFFLWRKREVVKLFILKAITKYFFIFSINVCCMRLQCNKEVFSNVSTNVSIRTHLRNKRINCLNSFLLSKIINTFDIFQNLPIIYCRGTSFALLYTHIEYSENLIVASTQHQQFFSINRIKIIWNIIFSRLNPICTLLQNARR